MELEVDGETFEFNSYGNAAGIGDDGEQLLVFGTTPGGVSYLVSLNLPRSVIVPGTTDLDLLGVTGAFGTFAAGSFQLVGFINGTLSFEEAGTNEGDRLRGVLNGAIHSSPE